MLVFKIGVLNYFVIFLIGGIQCKCVGWVRVSIYVYQCVYLVDSFRWVVLVLW